MTIERLKEILEEEAGDYTDEQLKEILVSFDVIGDIVLDQTLGIVEL